MIPVPTLLEEDQIHVGDRTLIDHLDAYSAPRLVECFDENPCVVRLLERMPRSDLSARVQQSSAGIRNRSLGVTVEAEYTIGEYDIVILPADQSNGLETWLRENGYRIPSGASNVLGSYIKQGMRFFVARVNLEEQSKLGFSYLRLLQVAYESPTFMLPIRLGTVNADGPQDLFVFALTRKGRIETTNYRDREAADRDGVTGVPQGSSGVRPLLSGHVHDQGRAGRQTDRPLGVRLGYELV